jgi:hypothetical protein
VGRWGSHEPWLGIPVEWDEISGARVIVEAGFRDFRVRPSQGRHLFQNLTAFQVGHFTVNPDLGEGSVDWKWLSAQSCGGERGCVRHLRFSDPLLVLMNGRSSQGMIFKTNSHRMALRRVITFWTFSYCMRQNSASDCSAVTGPVPPVNL